MDPTVNPDRPCWWLGVNNVRHSDHHKGHVRYPAIQPFLDGAVDSFEWRFTGSSPGSGTYYARMMPGDRTALWMGDGVFPDWGIIGFATIHQVDHADGKCLLKQGARATHPITPYPRRRPARTKTADFLRNLFGPSYRPLRKLYVRLGYADVKMYVATVDTMSFAQFTALIERAGNPIMRADNPITEFMLPEEVVIPAEAFIEGAVRQITVNAYERSQQNRDECIAEYGVCCCICGFEFGKVYGPEAEGFIHVHHIRPLSEVGKAHKVDPVKDLRPVCPNCHAVLHMGQSCRSIEDVRQLWAQRHSSTPAPVPGSETPAR